MECVEHILDFAGVCVCCFTLLRIIKAVKGKHVNVKKGGVEVEVS